MHRHIDRLSARHLHAGHIAVVIGLDDDDLIAGIDQSHDRAVYALSRASGDNDASFRIDINAIEYAGMPGDALA